ncbi:MAG: Holliday junction branch migration protein RuvA [Mariprofundaceae bacterium]|nr:Holliday junction branch migration protein RuvA [Mariprofundaceae bacterium]
MIGWLEGTVQETDPTTGSLLLNVNGVGYDIVLSMQNICVLQVGASTQLYIHSHIREEQFSLFGFVSTNERDMFRKLIQVSGIGVRTAMNVFSTMSVQQLLEAIQSSDDASIARTPGIGKKTALRMILELEGKLTMPESGDSPSQSNHSHMAHDVRSALVNLGYKPATIDKTMKKLTLSQDFEESFKMVLKVL